MTDTNANVGRTDGAPDAAGAADGEPLSVLGIRTALRSTIMRFHEAINGASVAVDDVGDPLDASDTSVATNALRDVAQQLNMEIDELAVLTLRYLQATQSLPPDAASASVQLAAHQVEYERLALASIDARHQSITRANEWAAEDAQTGRTRQRVVARLVAGGTAPTTAEKQASGDDEYTQHKDRVTELARDKEWAEFVRDQADIEAKVAFEKVQTTRMLLMALLTTQQVKLQQQQSPRASMTRTPASVKPVRAAVDIKAGDVVMIDDAGVARPVTSDGVVNAAPTSDTTKPSLVQ